jgi:hypothetical protein
MCESNACLESTASLKILSFAFTLVAVGSAGRKALR